MRQEAIETAEGRSPRSVLIRRSPRNQNWWTEGPKEVAPWGRGGGGREAGRGGQQGWWGSCQAGADHSRRWDGWTNPGLQEPPGGGEGGQGV